jgi:tetratricopeptide (TPR) repeat protein
MKATLHSDAFKGYAGQFVWLEINVDDPANAAFLAKSVEAYPILELIDPATEQATRVWAGTASPAQLAAFLDGKPDEAVARGDALLARGDGSGAAGAYEQALAHDQGEGPAREHVLEQLAVALQIGDPAACVARLARVAPAMARQAPFVQVVIAGAACAAQTPQLAGSPEMATLEGLAREALTLPSAFASEDDHYQLYEDLYLMRTGAKDAAGATALAQAYLSYVQQQPAPRNDDERMARDLALLRASTKAGVADKAIPQLEASEQALATDPDASLRLATVYAAAGRADDAIAATTRGLARAPKPTQTARLLMLRARLEAKRGDGESAKRDLEAARAAAQRINQPQSRDATIAQLEQLRSAL